MSLKTLLKDKTFNDYITEAHASMKACCEISLLSYLTPAFDNFMKELGVNTKKTLEYIIMTSKSKDSYMLVREISLGVQIATVAVSASCWELYNAGVLKRRKCKGKTGNITYEYAVINGLLVNWVIMKNTKVLTGIPEFDKAFAGGLKPDELVCLYGGSSKRISELAPGDTLVGSNGLCAVVK